MVLEEIYGIVYTLLFLQKQDIMFLGKFNLCVTSYYLSYFLIFRTSFLWSFDLGYPVQFSVAPKGFVGPIAVGAVD